jgi:hypothetical protein
MFKKPMHREIDIHHVSKIEYAEFKTEADMNVYEIYYINKYKPPLNRDDKAQDDLTFVLPEVKWEIFNTPLWDKWKNRIDDRNKEERIKKEKEAARKEQLKILRQKWHNGEISEDEYYQLTDKLL